MKRHGRSACHFLFLFLPLLLGGCVAVPERGGFAEVQGLADERLGQKLHWRLGAPEDAEADRAVARLLAEELSAEGAVQVALLRNADLQVTYERLGVVQADLVQAGLLKNPVFAGFARFPDRAPSKTNIEFEVALNFLDLLMLPARKRLASTQFEGTRLQVAQKVLELATGVRKAYFRAVSAEGVARMRRLVAEAAHASFEMATRIHEAGNLSDLKLALERGNFEKTRVAQAHSEMASRAAREELIRLLGLWGEEVVFKLPTQLPNLPMQEIPAERLESHAVAHRLDLAAAMQEMAVMAQALDIAVDWRWLGGVEVGASTERDTDGQWVTGPTLALELPLFDQGQAEIARQQALFRQSRQRLTALAVAARSEVRTLRDRLLMTRNLAGHYREMVIPLREQIVELWMKQYNYMLAGVFEALLAKQEEFDAYQEYIEAIRDYWITRAELQLALGGRLPEAGPSPLEELFAPGAEPVPPPQGDSHAHPS
jgi:cobalt-zinc-cadmium efflux system outer membrane protein